MRNGVNWDINQTHKPEVWLGGSRMSDVFVSYKAEDRARVAPLVQALESSGLSVWWDTQIAARSEWRSDIAEPSSTALDA